jgi:hypothetical protein
MFNKVIHLKNCTFRHLILCMELICWLSTFGRSCFANAPVPLLFVRLLEGFYFFEDYMKIWSIL